MKLSNMCMCVGEDCRLRVREQGAEENTSTLKRAYNRRKEKTA
jgi:hypothetical protein